MKQKEKENSIEKEKKKLQKKQFQISINSILEQCTTFDDVTTLMTTFSALTKKRVDLIATEEERFKQNQQS
jgi:hypothetical protein